MEEYEYRVDLDDPRYPGLVRVGRNGIIELYAPREPGKWKYSKYCNSLSEEEFTMDYIPCTEEDTKKYMAMIEDNVRAADAEKNT